MKHVTPPTPLVLALLLLWAAVPAAQVPYEDVVRNLRNPDPNIRMDSLRVLRDARYPESIVPIAALVNDPIDEIQLEAIATELSFFLVDEVPVRKRVGLFLEVRNESRAAAAFAAGPIAAWPAGAPPELLNALLRAVDDEHPRVRLEAIYTLGVVATPAAAVSLGSGLIEALDHYDPAIRVGAARVIGRLRVTAAGDALIAAMNDSKAEVRFAAMRAVGALGEERAVRALTEQFTHYGKGEGAWSALDGLARIAHPSSLSLLRAQLTARDEHVRRAAAEGLGRAGEVGDVATLQPLATTEESPRVRAALAFALQKLGQNYLDRLTEFLGSDRTAVQTQLYLLELGPAILDGLTARFQDPDDAIRERLAEVAGAIGDPRAIVLLTPMTQDRSRRVARAATNALERITIASRAGRAGTS